MSADDTAVSDREQRILGIIETARVEAPEVQGRADHDGARRRRQGDADADRGPARARLRVARRSRRLGDAGVVTVDGTRRRAHDRQLRRQADPLPRRLDRRAGRERDRQRPRRVGRAAAGAEPLAGPRGGAARPTSCAPRWRRSRPRPRRRERRDRRRRHQGRRARPRRLDVRLHDRASGRVDPRASLSPAALRPGDRVLVSGSIGEHGTAIMLARGELGLEADDRVRHAARCGRRPTRCSRRPGRSLRCMRDATRGRRRVGAERAGARVRRGDGRARGRRAGRPGGRGRGRAARHRPDVRRERGQAGRVRGARGARTPRSPRCARCRAASARPRSARSRPSRPGWCWWRPPSAASA